ncbi:MAG TPA: rod shape-determining protein MreD [Candidatus Angelobacter sp.]|nr:rod shape-determining protein MreD [Candidatus Angelobacter sp.]
MSITISYTSREEIAVHKFSWVAALGVPLLALLLQTFLARPFRFITIFDLPLLVTIFFGVARRRPITGLITGALIGSVQDYLAGVYAGLNGIAKTIIGYFASSLGLRLDVENPGSRFLMTFVFYLMHQVIYTAIDIVLVGGKGVPNWGRVLLSAFANGLLAVPLFSLLDRLKIRG